MAARLHQFDRPYVAVADFRSFVATRARNRFKELGRRGLRGQKPLPLTSSAIELLAH